jgi:proteasome lid subunit RPN8/RPN11
MNADVLAGWLREDRNARALAAHLVAAAPDEGCGIIVQGAGGLRLIPAPNLAGALHAADPESFPRDGRASFVLDTRVILDAARRGQELIAIVHSHVEVGAYFSDEDRRGALTPDGAGPLWPGVFQVVVDIGPGKMRGWRIYAFDRTAAGFVEVAHDPE